MRADLLERYQALPLPTTTDEHWRFTDLRGFDPGAFTANGATSVERASGMLDVDAAAIAHVSEGGIEIERAPDGVVFEGLEHDALRRALDLDPALAHVGDRGRVDVEHSARPLDARRPVHRESLGVEPAQVGEAPVLVGRRRKRKRLVALEEIGPHCAYLRCSIRSFPSGSVKNAMWQTPVS